MSRGVYAHRGLKQPLTSKIKKALDGCAGIDQVAITIGIDGATPGKGYRTTAWMIAA